MPVLTHSELTRLSRAREALGVDGPLRPIAELAAIAQMSRFHFMRRFQLVYGESPNQLRIRQRLLRARELLAGGHASVTEVCFQLGYSSLGTFSSLYRRRMGESPQAARRRLWSAGSSPRCIEYNLQPSCMSLLEAAWARTDEHFWRSIRAPVLQHSLTQPAREEPA